MKKSQIWKKSKMPKKQIILIAAASVLILAICITTVILAVRKKRAQEAMTQAAPTVTESVTESTQTTEPVSETETETETTSEITSEATTAPPKKPVGTTKPVEKEETSAPKIEPKPPQKPPIHLLNVPFIDQRQKYPTGCESVSAVMALQYYGLPISVETFIDKYLPKGRAPFRDETGERFGDDPRKVFLGSPYSDKGWGCYAPVIVNAVNKYIDHSQYSVRALYGASLDALCQTYIDHDIPVSIWATANMQPQKPWKESHTWTILGTSETFTWKSPMHCLVLVGYDGSGYYFNDPLQGKNFRYTKSEVQTAYNVLGTQAVVILPQPEETTDKPSTEPSPEYSGPSESTESENSALSPAAAEDAS